jgi:hypothetical protein
MTMPLLPKIYHIVHVDRLSSIITDKHLWCDAEIVSRDSLGTAIGMSHIKQRRLNELGLNSHPGLYVGGCVPFYFCPRSIMLYLIHQGNHFDLAYRGGQDFIIHLEADLRASVTWASENNRRWAFTLSNAGARFFEDRNNLAQLNEIDWESVQANKWSGNGIASNVKEHKQAEFLMESSFPWHLIERVGVYSQSLYQKVVGIFPIDSNQPLVEIKPAWYY